jgi:hypothetical protein
MNKLEEELPLGAAPRFDVDRGQEVVHVAEDLSVRTWACPYCGPKTFHAPRFRATRAQLLQLERQIEAMVPKGSELRVLRCAPPDEDGLEEWTMHAAVAHSSPMLAGD